ncbi:MAG: inositol monophosphatase family protein [Eubacteriales bacterium]|nr:inositol monophosphatase family protein [Eubacteriales bacterium]
MLNAIDTIVRESGRMMLKETDPEIILKEGHANYVTQTDRDVQDFLLNKLTALMPGSAFFGEEQENDTLTQKPTWVVDPIDGTTNYIRGLHHSSVSVALSVGKRLELAAVYNPYRDEMFLAQAGGGARLNDQAIRCAETPFEHAVVSFGSSLYVPGLLDATMSAVREYMRVCGDLRRFGSAALDLAYVACGRCDVFFEYSLSPWDYAAGLLLVQEAGGKTELLNIPGDILDFSRPASVFAASAVCFEKARAIAAENKPGENIA